ncbi:MULTISPECIES: M20/M25/M40 family metallo-hydrolase [unclassified Archaeoglobus]|jgi:acetylornithine deacetylase|uniref:M20/M25/M40 family metallo-hydrolase n=1 Tax=unclassified Archaeoglobus TaxID=2643606 RepID=UPI0025C70BD5|nr:MULTISPECIES: M20/M25/M40 family metallo-hydrolase [unclassified Archaeoglobus]
MLIKRIAEIESPSGKEEKLREFVKTYLEDLGYDVLEGDHFIATRSRSRMIVATHLDTVSVKAPFSTDGVYAYGTGVCDAKASVAAILEAAESGLDFTLAFFCDEEEGGKGSKEFAEFWRQGEMAIVMEPTDLKIASKHYGSFDLIVEVLGKACHGSMPEMGVNAIERACEMMVDMKRRFRATPLKIEGGSEEYVIPSRCYIKFDVLVKPGTKLEDCIKELEFLRDYGNFEVSDAHEGFESGGVVTILEKAMEKVGMEPVHTEMRSWTDALNLKDRFDAVVWGPGELHCCHTEREKVKLEDIRKARDVLLALNDLIKSAGKCHHK